MSLSHHIKTQAPGWTVRRLATRLGYNENSLQRMYRQHPERFELWLKGLRFEAQQSKQQSRNSYG